MNPYKLLSVLLAYPSADLQAAIKHEIMPILAAHDFSPVVQLFSERATSEQVASEQVALGQVAPGQAVLEGLSFATALAPLVDYLVQSDLIQIQENYVATFDRTPKHSLHLFEHLHGEHRDRGQAMVNLLQEYQAQGFEPIAYELPDYLPLFLEFLSLQEADKAAELLGEAIHVVAYIGANLQESQSVYASIFDLLIALSPVAPQELKVVPVRDMDEALEMFGPGADGVEPLLSTGLSKNLPNGMQPMSFYPNAASSVPTGVKS